MLHGIFSPTDRCQDNCLMQILSRNRDRSIKRCSNAWIGSWDNNLLIENMPSRNFDDRLVTEKSRLPSRCIATLSEGSLCRRCVFTSYRFSPKLAWSSCGTKCSTSRRFFLAQNAAVYRGEDWVYKPRHDPRENRRSAVIKGKKVLGCYVWYMRQCGESEHTRYQWG